MQSFVRESNFFFSNYYCIANCLVARTCCFYLRQMCVCVLQIVNHEPNKLIMLSAFACTLPARPLTRHGERLAHLTWGFLGVMCFRPPLGAQLWVWLVVVCLGVFGILPPSGCSTIFWIVGVVGSGWSGCFWYCAPFWVLNEDLDSGCCW